MNDKQLTKQFIRSYSDIFRLFHQRWHTQKEKPTMEACAIMLHLQQTGPLTIGEASKHFNRSFSAMSEIVTRMINRGWLEKQCDRKDKRIKYIWPTAKGEGALAKASVALDEQDLLQAMMKMSKESKVNLIKSLSELTKSGSKYEM